MADTVTVEIRDWIATVTLDRPDRRNAINGQMLDALEDQLGRCVADDNIRGVIIHGAGDDFCSGVDLDALQDLDGDDAVAWSEQAETITGLLEHADLFTAAAIHGHCLGGGHELALACDIRFAAADAQLGQPETRLGLIPGFGGTARLPRLIGLGRAKTLILSGTQVSGEEAYNLGLVDGVVPEEEVMAETRSFVRTVADTTSQQALQAAKDRLHAAVTEPLDDALQRERDAFADRLASADAEEGIAAFLADRTPDFPGDDG